ncbi:MAG: TonB-dependent receptor [Candidatus Symbiothrix sp.]|jgi:outer membrane cobalamin receptor|nr:TonB-dependent receptor [Candidatus Symbiothrix sp.]
MTKKQQLLFLFLGFTLIGVKAQSPDDTTLTRLLREVEVRAVHPSTRMQTTPTQVLTSEQIERLNALQASDALKQIAGVQVKDYGGIGGLKTVSIRNLGANYTTVAYDGVAMSDYQTGQMDLGRFSLNNVENISVSIGENDELLQPARNLALGGIINIVSRSENQSPDFRAGLKAGSWQMVSPYLAYGTALSPTVSLHLFGEYLQSKGDYPFSLYGENRRRIHSETQHAQLESKLTGDFREQGRLEWKIYYYDSDRNLPSPVISYNPYAGETMQDHIGFSHLRYTREWQAISLEINAKISLSEMNYQHLLYPDYWNNFVQTEYYANATLLYQPTAQWSFAWANDGSYGNGVSQQNRLQPTRSEWCSALSGKYETPQLVIRASLLNQLNRLNGQHALKNHFSPSISLSVKPFKIVPARLRISYRNSWRMPTFADMYYPPMANTGLQPENAHQYNLGLTWLHRFNDWLPLLSASADAYYNRIENKIVTYAGQSLALWSVQNRDEVFIKGLDIHLLLHLQASRNCRAELKFSQTWQQALDQQARQIRYTPQSTTSAWANLIFPWFEINYNLLYCGERYYNETPSSDSLLPHYTEHGLSICRKWKLSKSSLRTSVECVNLTNEQYVVVRSYPMPGRAYRLNLNFIY